MSSSPLVPTTAPAPAMGSNLHLEAFPPELRRMILFAMDLPTLHGLIYASPVYYRQYRNAQVPILSSALYNSLGSSIKDAMALKLARAPAFTATRSKEQAYDILQAYNAIRAVDDMTALSMLSVAEMEQIGGFHTRTVRHIKAHFILWTHDNAGAEFETPLSTTEENRLCRALYRYELSCQLFGFLNIKDGRWPADRRHREWAPLEILQHLLYKFEPWEIEEVLCVQRFAEGTYATLVEEEHQIIKERGILDVVDDEGARFHGAFDGKCLT